MQFSQLPAPVLFSFIGLIVCVGIGLIVLRSQSLQTNTLQVLGEATASFSSLSPADFKQVLSEKSGSNVQLIDIRTPSEAAQGKIAGALVLDYYDPGFSDALSQLDRSKTYYIYCNSGNRTSSTLEMMKQMNFSAAYDLKGGMVAWLSAGLETCTQC